MTFDFVTLDATVPNKIYCQAMGIIYSNLSVSNIKTDFELQDKECIYHFTLSECNTVSGVVAYINDLNTEI